MKQKIDINKRARKVFRPICASQNFLEICLEVLRFFGDFLGIILEFSGNSLEILKRRQGQEQNKLNSSNL